MYEDKAIQSQLLAPHPDDESLQNSMSLDEGFYFQGDMKSFQRYEPNHEPQDGGLSRIETNESVDERDKKDGTFYCETLSLTCWINIVNVVVESNSEEDNDNNVEDMQKEQNDDENRNDTNNENSETQSNSNVAVDVKQPALIFGNSLRTAFETVSHCTNNVVVILIIMLFRNAFSYNMLI
jgi:hypothetical protein